MNGMAMPNGNSYVCLAHHREDCPDDECLAAQNAPYEKIQILELQVEAEREARLKVSVQLTDTVDQRNAVLLRNDELRFSVYSWLGFWRDKFPDAAVLRLQDILGPLEKPAEEILKLCGAWEPGLGPCIAVVPCKVHAADKQKCACECHVGGEGASTACGCCSYPR
jgi:hypothetical protein